MLKSELGRVLNKKLPDIEAQDVELAINCMLKQMMTALEQGERIEIRGFGCFSLHNIPARTNRNPKTGAAVQSPAKVTIHFKPGSATRSRVQKLFLLQRKKPSVSPDESRGLNKERP